MMAENTYMAMLMVLCFYAGWWAAKLWRRRQRQRQENVEPLALSGRALEAFVLAFSSHVSGSVRDCACGRTFYNPDTRSWDWEDGELDDLNNDATATPVDWSVGTIFLEGQEFVTDCDCWRKRAARIVRWMQTHDHAIAEWLRIQKRMHEETAQRSPVVE